MLSWSGMPIFSILGQCPPTEPRLCYRLNSSHILSWYAEDVTRVPALGALGNFTLFFTTTMVIIHLPRHSSSDLMCRRQCNIGELVTADPSPARLKSWESKTRTAFDLLEAEPSMQKEVVCPQCHTESYVRESEKPSLRTLDDLLSSQHSSRPKGTAMPNNSAPYVPLDHAVLSLRPPHWESQNLLKICSGTTAQITPPLRQLTFYLTIPHL